MNKNDRAGVSRRLVWLAAALALGFSAPPACARPTFAEGKILGIVTERALGEVSGIVASRNNPDVLWVHNDSGDSARVFAIDTGGRFLGAFTLPGIRPGDIEDIAIGPGPVRGVDYLYVGDIGDNYSHRRNGVFVYRVVEPVVRTDGGDQSRALDSVDRLRLVYPDGPRDAETLLCDPVGGELYVITKRDAGNRIYGLGAPVEGDQDILLQYKGSMSWPILATAALGAVAGDVSPDGSEVLIKNYSGIFLYQRPPGTPLWKALVGQTDFVSVTYKQETQGEAVSFDAVGSGYYTLSEGANQPLYYYRRTSDGPKAPLTLVGAGTNWQYADGIFQAAFKLEEAMPVEQLTVKLVCDRDAVVLVNGRRVAGTEAAAPRKPKAPADTWVDLPVDRRVLGDLLVAGKNSVAVAITPAAADAAEVTFDLQLLATPGQRSQAAWLMIAGAALGMVLLAWLWRRGRKTRPTDTDDDPQMAAMRKVASL